MLFFSVYLFINTSPPKNTSVLIIPFKVYCPEGQGVHTPDPFDEIVFFGHIDGFFEPS